MLGLETQYKLKEFLQTVAELELQVERQRQLLATLSDFEPFAAFQRVNRNGDDIVTGLEIYNFLRDNGVNHATLKEVQLIVKYFDLDNDGALKYPEFMQLLLPCDDMYLRSAATQRPNYKVGRYDNLPSPVEKELANLLERELNYHVRLERLKYDLTLRYDWTSRAAFETIDSTRDLALNSRNIQSFLRLNGFYATESEIVAIVRRLDVDADQKVTYSEWADGVSPQLSGADLGTSSLSASRREEEKRPVSPLRESGYQS
jgi:Ca2+-binding EF-hand superfamily protein